MALVTAFESSRKERTSVHKPTRCLYAVVEGNSGQRYFQIDTLGSDERQISDKVSQSIQFDGKAARELIELLRQTFPDIA